MSFKKKFNNSLPGEHRLPGFFSHKKNLLNCGVAVQIQGSKIQSLCLNANNNDLLITTLNSNSKSTETKELITNWLDSFFSKETTPEIFEILNISGSSFTQDVLAAIASIPRGSVASYKQIATAANSPKAARAIGNICNKNKFPLIIPCHRVVSSTGIGGYAYGLPLKKHLLSLEGYL